MISKLDKSEHWVVKLWAKEPQLARAISNLDYGKDGNCSRGSDGELLFLTHRDEMWQLGLKLAQKLHVSLWEDVLVSVDMPADENTNSTPYTLTEFHHHFVSPWITEAILNREIDCFRRPIAEAESRHHFVADEFFLQLNRGEKSVGMRELFEFSSRFGFHNELHWMAIEECLPHSYSCDRKTFINVDTANFFLDCYSWFEILDATAENTIDVGNVVFEISLIGESDEQLLSAVSREIRARGFEIALDDWGQKNNSIRTLNLVRPDYLKVSEQLIHGMHSDPYRQKLISGMVRFASDLGIKTVAEGVGNADDWSSAVEAGFLWLQGDYVGKPSAPPPPDASFGCAPLCSASFGSETLIGKCQ